MKWDWVTGSWKQVQGKAREPSSNRTDDDLGVIAGKRDVLVGKPAARTVTPWAWPWRRSTGG